MTCVLAHRCAPHVAGFQVKGGMRSCLRTRLDRWCSTVDRIHSAHATHTHQKAVVATHVLACWVSNPGLCFDALRSPSLAQVHRSLAWYVLRRTDGSGDIFYLEVCLFNTICKNGHELFAMHRVGRNGLTPEFRCQLDQAGVERLKQWLMYT